MTERTIKIKGLIHDEVCMGTYGLVELELLEIEKEMEALQQLAVSNSIAVKYAEFCVRCDRENTPLLCLEDYIKQYCC